MLLKYFVCPCTALHIITCYLWTWYPRLTYVLSAMEVINLQMFSFSQFFLKRYDYARINGTEISFCVYGCRLTTVMYFLHNTHRLGYIPLQLPDGVHALNMNTLCWMVFKTLVNYGETILFVVAECWHVVYSH